MMGEDMVTSKDNNISVIINPTQLEKIVKTYKQNLYYSVKYFDDNYAYRNVTLPPEIAQFYNPVRRLTEKECGMLGVQQSPGWEHYFIYRPDTSILMFRRPITYEPNYDPVNPQKWYPHDDDDNI